MRVARVSIWESSGTVSWLSFTATSLNPLDEAGDEGADDECDRASASDRGEYCHQDLARVNEYAGSCIYSQGKG